MNSGLSHSRLLFPNALHCLSEHLPERSERAIAVHTHSFGFKAEEITRGQSTDRTSVRTDVPILQTQKDQEIVAPACPACDPTGAETRNLCSKLPSHAI